MSRWCRNSIIAIVSTTVALLALMVALPPIAYRALEKWTTEAGW